MSENKHSFSIWSKSFSKTSNHLQPLFSKIHVTFCLLITFLTAEGGCEIDVICYEQFGHLLDFYLYLSRQTLQNIQPLTKYFYYFKSFFLKKKKTNK